MQLFVVSVTAFMLVSILDLCLATVSLHNSDRSGKYLAYSCLGAGVVTACYTGSIFVSNYFVYSILTSLYFSGISFLLTALLLYILKVTVSPDFKLTSFPGILILIYLAADAAIMMVNPFVEIAIHYIPSGTVFSPFVYEMYTPYKMHLVFTYILVALILILLIRKAVLLPSIYRRPYLYCIGTILAVVALNAVFLFSPNTNHLDYSLLGYSLAAYFFYWCFYRYSTHGLMMHFHSWLFENCNQGVVLFDFENRLILHNDKAAAIMPAGTFQKNMLLKDFLKAVGIKAEAPKPEKQYSFQCFINGLPVRCDYSVHVDRSGQCLGRLFVFSDIATEYDLLTGFRSWDAFKQHADTLFPKTEEEQVVAVCDINSLTDINRKYGRDRGDEAIQRLAEVLMEEFGANAEFTRSREASVAIICTGLTVRQVEEKLSNVSNLLAKDAMPIQIQSSVSVRTDESVIAAVRRNLQSMSTKKLMDRTSVHSEVLHSLLQALEQCDSDTGAHVQRTQMMGKNLGARIGLTNQEQGELALLAILHDIGKIGIPLEILNKPGKLNDAEWKKMQSHVNKGFQIARSSQELSPISDMILYHHERWDGRGYPKGISGDQIPLLSRIIAVVDAYDAMTNDRVYRKALSESAARSELRRCAGTQFDPHIVNEFIAMLEENDQRMGITVSTMSDVDPAPIPAAPSPAEEPKHPKQNVHMVPFGKYLISGKGIIIEANKEFETITGYTAADLKNHPLSHNSLLFPEDLDEYYQQIKRYLSADAEAYLKHRLRRKDGTGVYVNCYGRRFYDSAAEEERVSIVILPGDEAAQE